MPLAGVAFIGYLIFAWVSIWRCSRNTQWPTMGEIARIAVLLFAVVVCLVARRPAPGWYKKYVELTSIKEEEGTMEIHEKNAWMLRSLLK